MYQILVAEEDDAERQALCACLERKFREHCRILTAENGAEAVELFVQNRPQAAVLSIEMPGLTGLEAARRIRQSCGACGLVFLMDREVFSYAREAIRLRAADCLVKPWREAELIRSVEEALHLSWLYAAELHPGAEEGTREEAPAGRQGQIRHTIESIIHERYDTELSMQDVAREMNYSDAYFCKLFRQCFGVNFSAYLNAYRIGRAKELLLTTQLNVREVSVACGYSDSNYFTRVFKRITGMTPSDYRMN